MQIWIKLSSFSFVVFQLCELLTGQVHGPAPHQAREQSLPTSIKTPDHGPHQENHFRAGHAG